MRAPTFLVDDIFLIDWRKDCWDTYITIKIKISILWHDHLTPTTTHLPFSTQRTLNPFYSSHIYTTWPSPCCCCPKILSEGITLDYFLLDNILIYASLRDEINVFQSYGERSSNDGTFPFRNLSCAFVIEK